MTSCRLILHNTEHEFQSNAGTPIQEQWPHGPQATYRATIGRNLVYSCKYHVVWCPKYRRKVLVNGVDERLKQIIQATAMELQAEVIELEVMPDHVHLLCEVDPQFGVHRLVRHLKGRSSRLLR